MDMAAWGGVALLGLVCLYIPFHGDQVIHLLGALKIRAGGVLYRDFWDLKQPGIFYFYYLGGYLFGFSEVGIHLWELIYQLFLAILMTLSLRGYFNVTGMASLAPILSVGSYYAVATPWHLTQIEAVVGAPLLLAAWTSSQAVGNSHRIWWLVFSGVTGGVVGLLKFVYLPVAASFWACTLAYLWFSGEGQRIRCVLRAISFIILGASVPIGAVAGYFIAHGLTEILYKTFFTYPLYIIENLRPRYWVLKDGLWWFWDNFSILVAFGLIGAYRIVRRPNPYLINLVLWVLVGLIMVAAQRMWWQYHYLIVSVPIGVLSALGIDWLWHSLKRSDNVNFSTMFGRAVLVLALVAAAGPLTKGVLKKAAYAVADRPWSAQGDLHRYRDHYGNYHHRQAIADFLLQPASRRGDIFIFGDPTLYWLGQREQAGALHGWSTDGYTPEQWMWLSRDLQKSKPPYIFIPPKEMGLIRQRSGDLKALLESEYRLILNTDLGTWYEHVN